MTSTTAPAAVATEAPSRLTLPIVLAAQFVTPMSIAGTAIALPRISADLGSQQTALQWVVNGFNISFAVFTLVWGALSDRFGSRRTFAIGAGLVAAGSAASAAAPNLYVLDIARVVAGIGAAAILTGATSLLSNAYTGAKRTQAFAVFGTVNGLGLAVGPTVSGALVAAVDWRGVFVVHAVVLLVAAVGARALPAVAPAAAGPRGPILDLGLLRNREFLGMCLVPVAGSIGFVTLLTYLPSALSGIKGISAGAAGVTMLALTIPVLVAPLAVAQIVTRFPKVTVGVVVYVSLAVLILGNLGVLLLAEDRSVGWIIVPMVLLGLGFGLPIGLVDGHALAVVPADRSGTAAGVLNFFRIGSEAIFVAGYALVLATVVGTRLHGSVAADTAAGQPGHPDVYRAAFTTTVLVLVALLIALTVAIVAIRRRAASAERAGSTVSATEIDGHAAEIDVSATESYGPATEIDGVETESVRHQEESRT